MEPRNAEIADTIVLTAEQLVDLSLSPYHIDVNLLHTLLHMLVSKLNLHSTRVQLATTYGLMEINNMASKTTDIFEIFNVVEGGAQKPFKVTTATKLKKLEPDPDVNVDRLYKIHKAATEGKDFRRVTFHKNRPITDGLEEKSTVHDEGVGYTYAELLNITKRLECCEIGIEKLAELLQQMSGSYKNLEKSVLDISTIEMRRKNLDIVYKPIAERSSQTQGLEFRDIETSAQASIPSSNRIRRDTHNRLSFVQNTATNLVDQVNTMSEQITNFTDMMQALKDDNEKLKRNFERSANGDMLDRCCKEICNIQKQLAQYADKTSNLISASNNSDKRFKSISEQLAQYCKLRDYNQKIGELQDDRRKLNEQFDTFTERLEQVKIIKADREELDFLFQCKADRDDLQRLVSLDLFNAIRHDLSSGIVQAFENIMKTELKWKRSEENIIGQLKDKMDNSEKVPLTNYINDRLGSMQDQLNKIVYTRFDIKSAAIKTRALKNANCICCASEADLVCDKPTLPKLGPMTRKRICPEPIDFRKRYCGGSHTTLSSTQKMVQRRTMPIYSDPNWESPILVEGMDGMMYRVSQPACICGDEGFPKIIYPKPNREQFGENQGSVGGGDEVRGRHDSPLSKTSKSSKASKASRSSKASNAIQSKPDSKTSASIGKENQLVENPANNSSLDNKIIKVQANVRKDSKTIEEEVNIKNDSNIFEEKKDAFETDKCDGDANVKPIKAD